MFHVKQNSLEMATVSRETEERLSLYCTLLRRWSARINLVARSDLDHLRARHINDCLQLLPLLPSVNYAIDLGSGAGFPGLVLAIATGIHFNLIEADQRKAAFLREAARETAAPAQVHAVRIEAAALKPAALITARALAPLDILLSLATPLLDQGGLCLFPKGRQADAELTRARQGWHMQVQCIPSCTQPESCILAIREPRRASPAL